MSRPGEPSDRPDSTARTAAASREDIDAGRAGDKVDTVDPAAAPLGTDDEAAGRKHEAEIIALAARRERRRPVGTDPDRTQAGGMEHGGWTAWIVVGVALVLAIFGVLIFAD